MGTRARTTTTATTIALLAAGLIAGPASAQHIPDTPGCVTRSEYLTVVNGWSRARVTHQFETAGWRVKFYPETATEWAGELRGYEACNGATVGVGYIRRSDGIFRVIIKRWFRP